ncbi:hypothetical protein AGLY_016420 [Aphis glycines]|uniref:Integrase catalytic domain-containing protein n=1 Tax=Aphis glycines TaxID=307491 RepID=A0A6G0SZV7_APHGL|nr:hypothetical protein AGLY_016420 [Aphis glycines]
MRNDLPMKSWVNECGVLNLNDSTQNGSHWVAWKKMKNKKIYFDSFGINPPPKELVNYLGKHNLWYTDRKFQDYNDPPICGHLTKNINATKIQTVNGRWRISTKCFICKTNKSKFIKAPEIEHSNNSIISNKKLNDTDKLLLAKELHKPVRKRFPKRRIITHGIDDLWAVDLVIMRNFSDENEGYCNIITVIDTFSKFAWAFPLKKKDGISVSKAFEKIIEQAKTQNHQTPKLLHADKGLEFENKHFKNVLKKYSIHMYHTQNEEKSAIIERFNRTLNGKMRLCFEVQKSKKWINILQNLLDEYNFKDIHRSIGMKPCEVNKSNEDDVLHKLFSTKNKPKPKIKFSVGDRVRIKAYKKTFVKKNDNINKMDNKKTYPNKTCDKCNLTIDYTNWSAHLKSGRHGKNDIDQTIVPFRFNRTYKGIPINQEKEKKYNYIKLMKNDIKKYVKKKSKKDNLYVNFCAFEYSENTKTVKYNLHKIPIVGNIFIIDQGNDQFGNGNPYISKLLKSPTWLELCKIANDLIITTGDYTHHYLDDIKIVEDLGIIKMFKRNVNNNKMDNKKTYPNKTCDKCNLTVSYKSWSRHLKSIRHQTNDVDQTIKPKFNKTYKGIPTKQIKTKKERIPKTNNKQIRTKKERIPKPHKVFNFSAKMFNSDKKDNRPILETKETAFESRLITYIIKNNMGIKDIQLFLNRLDNAVIGRLKKSLTNKNLKVNIMFLAIFKRSSEENIEYKECNFKTKNEILTKNSNLNDFYTNAKIKIVNEVEDFVMKNSQWRLDQILSLGININKYVPFKGSSYIPLPENIKNKHAIINVKNEDDKCFLWAILSALHRCEKDPQRVTKYKKWKNDFDKELKGIEFPVKTTDVPKFVKRTKDISINIYYLEEKGNNTHIIVPLEITKIEKTNHIDLMYLREDNENKGHYCWIKNLWKLVGSQMTKDGHRRLLCKMCLNSFDTENKLNDHKHYCGNNKAAKIVLPEPYNNTLEFEKYNNSLRIPFVIYFDFESTLQPIYSCQPNDKESFTKCYQKHIPNNFCYYIKYSYGDYKPPVEYSGPNVAKEFFNCIQNEEIAISEIYDEIVPMETLNAEQLNNYNKSVKCHICERFLSELPPRLEKKLKIYVAAIEYYKQLNDDDNICLYKSKIEEAIKYKKLNMRKVCDHDHLTGEYRGAAHSICNLTYKNPTFIPIVCHNLSGYDAHLFIRQFGNDNNDITLIPNNEEKYISFSKIIERTKYIKGEEIILKTELRFIDSFKFLSSSLDKLTNNLEKHQFKDLSKYFPEEHLNLVTRKLAYPYEYMDCEEKFNETCLPPREKFYSSLTGKNITIEEYENSQKIWEVFKIQNLREFTNPLWYYTTPGFAWDSMLRMTKVKLDLLTDIDQILMFESGIRGGLSQCSQRYSKANNKYMGDKFKKKEESIFLQYLDANNLYGWAMSKYLPTGDFKWVNNLNNFDVMGISDESPKGYILEVDLSYSKELHDLHSDFPLAPEKHFDDEQLPKLLTSLKITKIHRVLEFSQSPWLKVYIDFNTDFRSKAKNEFEKDYFKLMNNSVYGRTMMNKKYGNRVRLLYTDTDSLILEIKTDDFYQDIKINLDHFDTSDYPKDNIYDLPLVNKKVLGKFKDELNGKIMTEFIGLRSKLYSHRILDSEKEIKKSKGVKKNVVENKICFDDFKNCLLTKKPKYVIQNLFRTKKHDIFTVEQNKKALSVYDDKRFILNNGIDTLAWGHYKTNIDRNDFVNHLNTLIRNQNKKD